MRYAGGIQRGAGAAVEGEDGEGHGWGLGLIYVEVEILVYLDCVGMDGWIRLETGSCDVCRFFFSFRVVFLSLRSWGRDGNFVGFVSDFLCIEDHGTVGRLCGELGEFLFFSSFVCLCM